MQIGASADWTDRNSVDSGTGCGTRTLSSAEPLMEFLPSECSPTPRNPTLALRSSRFFSLAPRPNGDHSLRCTRVMMAPFFLAPERERRPARSAALLFPPQKPDTVVIACGR